MKRRISWHFDLTLDYEPRSWRGLLILAMMLSAVGELASENVTLTTYYPAPSGVYGQMIVTGNTYLARDGGQVGIGTSAPGDELDVAGGNGNIRATGEIQSTMTNGGAFGQFRMIAGNYGAFFRNDGANTYLLLTASGQQYGVWNGLRPFYVNDVSGDVQINSMSVQAAGNVSVGGNITANGGGGNRGYVSIANGNTACTEFDFVQGPICAAGQYASWQPGLNVQGWSYANRGGQVLAQDPARTTTQVWGLDTVSGVAQWMTLEKDDHTAHGFCCPL